MAGFFVPQNYNVMRYQAAARECDDLASKLCDQANKIFTVTD